MASVSNMGSYDNLKATLSVGELEFTDLHSVQVMGMDDDEVLSPPEKVFVFFIKNDQSVILFLSHKVSNYLK